MGNFYRAESECSKIFTQKCKLSTVNRALLSITQTCGNKKHSVSAATTPRVSRQARNPVTIPYCREMFMDLAFMKFWQCSKVTKNKLTHTHTKKQKQKTKLNRWHVNVQMRQKVHITCVLALLTSVDDDSWLDVSGWLAEGSPRSISFIPPFLKGRKMSSICHSIKKKGMKVTKLIR